MYGEGTYGKIERVGKFGDIDVGKYCSIGAEVQWVSVGHNMDWVTTYPFSGKGIYYNWNGADKIIGHPKKLGNLRIGNDVWIGYGAKFVGDIEIADGAVIGAYSVVRQYVPPYGIVYGNPAFLTRSRFPEYVRERLLEIKWWDWPKIKIEANMELLCSDNIEEFLETHYNAH